MASQKRITLNAIFFLVLCCCHEVHAKRALFQSHTLGLKLNQTNRAQHKEAGAQYTSNSSKTDGSGPDDEADMVMPDVCEADKADSDDCRDAMKKIWKELAAKANTKNKTNRCSGNAKQLSGVALKSMMQSVARTSFRCKSAAQENEGKCLDSKNGPSSTLAVAQAWELRKVIQKLAVCPWASKLFDSFQKQRPQMMGHLQFVYDNAAELKDMQKKFPLDFNAASRKVDGLGNVETEDEALAITVEAIRALVGQKGTRDAFQSFNNSLPEASADPADDAKILDDEAQVNNPVSDPIVDNVQVNWCFRTKGHWVPLYGHVGSFTKGCGNSHYFYHHHKCFQFTSTKYGKSEDATNNSVPPTEEQVDLENILLVEDDNSHVDRTDKNRKRTKRDGYLRNSINSWGICLPPYKPNEELMNIRESAKEIKGSLQKVTTEMEVDPEISGLLQQMQGGVTSKQGIGFVLQIVGVVGALAVLLAGFVLGIVFALTTLLLRIVTAPLLIADALELTYVGNVLRFFRMLAFVLPCFIMSVFYGVSWVLLKIFSALAFVGSWFSRFWMGLRDFAPDGLWTGEASHPGSADWFMDSNLPQVCSWRFHLDSRAQHGWVGNEKRPVVRNFWLDLGWNIDLGWGPLKYSNPENQKGDKRGVHAGLF